MSSMFKKKGGLSFKPKLSSARPRPAAPAAPTTTSQPPSAPEVGASTEASPQERREVTQVPSSEPPLIPFDPSVRDPPNQLRDKAITPPPTATAHEEVQNAASIPQDTTPVDRPEKQAEPTTQLITDECATTVPAPAISIESTAELPAPAVNERKPIPPETIETQVSSSTTQDAQEPAIAPVSQDNVPEETVVSGDQSVTVPTDPTQSIPDNTNETIEPQPVKPKPRSKRQSAKTSQEEGTNDDESTRPKKRQRKATQDGEVAPRKQPRKRKANSDGQAPSRPRRARSITPDDAEEQVVDLQKLKMSDLTKDLHIGRKFSRHDELRERERRAKIKAKPADSGDREEDYSDKVDGSGRSTAKNDSPAAPPSSGPAPTSGPQFRIVDGQIVVDQSSLVMDRHARAVAAQGDMETIEENDFTRLITSNSFRTTSKLRGPNIWNEEDTNLFYRGLHIFGTDFEIISKMFPGRQRRHVKLKFNREERHCPQRIDAALIGKKTIKMDIDEYKAFTGSEFESVDAIEAEQRKRQEDFEAKQQAAADEQAEIMRKKREELFADEEGEAGKKKKKGKKGKQAIAYGLNGEPISTEA